MEYPIVLLILAAYFGLVGAFAIGKKTLNPEPPPKGGVQKPRTKESFIEFYQAKAAQRQHDAVLAQRLSA